MESAAFLDARCAARQLRIWVDLENSPHVSFFAPVIDELRRRGHHVVVTGRRFCNTVALARARGLAVQVIGRGHDTGRNNVVKRAHHHVRVMQLRRFARTQRFDVAVGHVSRTQAAAAARLGIPVWSATDYEHSFLRDLRFARCFMVPSCIPVGAFDRAEIPRAAIRRYDGIKEDVYLHGFRPDAGLRRQLGIGEQEILVVFRPCSENAHYDVEFSHEVEQAVLLNLLGQAALRILVLPRTARQAQRWRAHEDGVGRLRVWAEPVDGPSLISTADLVVSGGGTMTREAAALGVPALSTFNGPPGAVDAYLARDGRLRMVRSVREAEQLGPVERRREAVARVSPAPFQQVVDTICATADS